MLLASLFHGEIDTHKRARFTFFCLWLFMNKFKTDLLNLSCNTINPYWEAFVEEWLKKRLEYVSWGFVHVAQDEFLTGWKFVRLVRCYVHTVEACVAEWWTPRTVDLEVRGSSLARRVASLDKELYFTLSLFTRLYKWVSATYYWG